MEQEELNGVLRRHEAWLKGKLYGERADLHGEYLASVNLQGKDLQHAVLRGAVLQHAELQHTILEDSDLEGAILRGADLRHSDLRGAKLRHSDLRGADLDYASWPLWCGSLKAYVDDRIAIQLLYHTLSVVQHSPFVSEEVKAKLLTPEIVSLANRFHRALEGGEIKEWEEGTK